MHIPHRFLWLAGFTVFIVLTAFQPHRFTGGFASQEPTATSPPESGSDTFVLSVFQDAVDVAVGYYHTCVITTDGGVMCWGVNDNGQLGNGTETYAATPVDVLDLPADVVSLAAGEEHTCVVTIDGKALCWGRNYFGQLGDGTNEDRLAPVEVVNLPEEIVDIGAGDWFTCALSKAGGVYCWGDNNYNHLGDGSGEDSLTAVSVLGLNSGVQAITVGDTNSCALKQDGSVVCWGAPGFLGFEGYDKGPLTVPGMENGVSMISAGLMHTCALKEGQVYCWGANQFGQLGDGQKVQVQIAPVAVQDMNGQIQSLASGGYHTCALSEEGVYCWGGNTYGQLGDGTNEERLSPVKVRGLSGRPTDLSAGVWHTCVVLEDNTVECWGLDRVGLLGSGRLMTEQLEPVQVVGLSEGVTAIDAGEISTCAVLQTGEIQCWGINDSLGLALGLTDDVMINPGVPQEIESLEGDYQAVVVGSSHACVLSSSGGVTCWGSNYNGQLGNGTDERSETVSTVLGLDSNVIALAAGDDHTCALKGDSSVVCWGQNYSGQVGDGSTEHRFSPVEVIGLPAGIRSLSAGDDDTCVIIEGGELYCWGSNSSGKLIPGSWGDETTALQISGIDVGVIDIALGSNHTCALDAEGEVWCWGDNEFGQLGDGTVEESESFVKVSGLNDVQAIAAGMDYTCALTGGNDLYCWGIFNSQSLTTDQSPQFNTEPVKISSFSTDVLALTGGNLHLCVLTAAGGVYCLGNNDAGQLGDDSLFAKSPVQVMELSSTPLASFRQAGPLVPELTTYIPTPLDLSTDPKVLGTNLALAALAMIPFALAAELFTKILAEQEELVRKRWRLWAKLGDSFSRLTGTLPGLPEWIRFAVIVLFYGIVFSLLDSSWKPFTLTGVVLLLEMTLAYGIIGLAGDLMQWRAARRKDLPASLFLRPSNVLLALVSTTASRLLKLVPGLMFGTPEALEIDESMLDETKRAWLQRISSWTLIGIGFGIWLPTALTAWLQQKPLSTGLATVLGGLEGFLLVIFAVALENIFIQMLGFTNTMGQALRKRNRWLWIISLVGVTFLFYHTLINPRGELATALQVGNVRFFLIVVGIFVVSTFGIWFFLRWKERRRIKPTPMAIPVEMPQSLPAVVEAVPAPEAVIAQPTCAHCKRTFTWAQSFRQINTPGSDEFNAPGGACYRPRLFCPHCGNMITEWHTTPTRDYDEWLWFGENRSRNENVPLPPSPISYGGGTTIPLQFTAYYDEHRVDVEKIKAYLAAQKEVPKPEGSQPWQEAYRQSFALFQRGEIQSSLETAAKAIQAGLPKLEQAAIYGAIGEYYLVQQEQVEVALEYLQKSVAIDPGGFWKAHFYLSLIHQARGEREQADQAYRDARRFAQTVWFTPQAEAQARAVVGRWTPTAAGEEEMKIAEAVTPVEVSLQLAEDSKRCPQCAEVIKLEDQICCFCGTRFEIQIKGYCLNCHTVVELDEWERCSQCGAEVIDRHVKSTWLGDEAAVSPPIESVSIPVPAPPVPGEVKSEAGKRRLWKSAGCRGAAVIIFLGLAFGAYLLIKGAEGIPSLSAASPTKTQTTNIALASVTSPPPSPTATKIPTATSTSVPTPTPIPTWVTEFAEPILDVIAQVPAHILYDFSSQAGGVYVWGCQEEGGCQIADGVMTVRTASGDGTGVGADGLRAEDFVLTFEVTPISLAQNSAVSLAFRYSEKGFYAFALNMIDGSWDISKHWYPDDRTEQLVRSTVDPVRVGEKVTLLFIARGSQFAIYMNDSPLHYFEDSEHTGDWKGINIHSKGGVTEIAFDNAAFWDLGMVVGLP